MTRYQTTACIIIAAINIASLVVIALAWIGSRDASVNENTVFCAVSESQGYITAPDMFLVDIDDSGGSQ